VAQRSEVGVTETQGMDQGFGGGDSYFHPAIDREKWIYFPGGTEVFHQSSDTRGCVCTRSDAGTELARAMVSKIVVQDRNAA
jgi:hypothetical protein